MRGFRNLKKIKGALKEGWDNMCKRQVSTAILYLPKERKKLILTPMACVKQVIPGNKTATWMLIIDRKNPLSELEEELSGNDE